MGLVLGARPLFASLAGVILVLAASGCATTSRTTTASTGVVASADSRKLAELFAADAAAEKKLSPLSTVARGESSPPADFALTYTGELLQRRRAALADSERRLAAIERDRLSASERISYDVFVFEKKLDAQALSPELAATAAALPMNHFYGLHKDYPDFVSGQGGAPFTTVAQYEENLARTRLLPTIFETATLQFRQGMASGVVASQLTTRILSINPLN